MRRNGAKADGLHNSSLHSPIRKQVETSDPVIAWLVVRPRASCNGRLQTPPGPEGSNGSGAVRVPRITRGLAAAHRMYQVIARKYRPQTFRDVVNQEHVK